MHDRIFNVLQFAFLALHTASLERLAGDNRLCCKNGEVELYVQCCNLRKYERLLNLLQRLPEVAQLLKAD